MQYKEGKFFKSLDDNKIYIRNINECDYYTFLKKQRKKRFSQIVISSQILLEILVNRFSENNSLINEIILENEDSELQEEINQMISNINQNPKEIFKLLAFFNEFNYGESIEIKKIGYSYRIESDEGNENNSKLTSIILYNTGYIEYYDKNNELKTLEKLILKCRNGK